MPHFRELMNSPKDCLLSDSVICLFFRRAGLLNISTKHKVNGVGNRSQQQASEQCKQNPPPFFPKRWSKLSHPCPSSSTPQTTQQQGRSCAWQNVSHWPGFSVHTTSLPNYHPMATLHFPLSKSLYHDPKPQVKLKRAASWLSNSIRAHSSMLLQKSPKPGRAATTKQQKGGKQKEHHLVFVWQPNEGFSASLSAPKTLARFVGHPSSTHQITNQKLIRQNRRSLSFHPHKRPLAARSSPRTGGGHCKHRIQIDSVETPEERGTNVFNHSFLACSSLPI